MLKSFASEGWVASVEARGFQVKITAEAGRAIVAIWQVRYKAEGRRGAPRSCRQIVGVEADVAAAWPRSRSTSMTWRSWAMVVVLGGLGIVGTACQKDGK